MADSAAKRIREAKKRHRREVKAERKRLRKEGLLGSDDSSGLFLPGEPPRTTEDSAPPAPPPPPPPEPHKP